MSSALRSALSALPLALLLSGCYSAAPSARPEVPVSQTSAAENARAIASVLREELGIPGLAVAVGRGEELLWSAGFGFADLELQVPVATTHRFRLASVSKLVTTAVAARLIDQGKLDLDAPVRSFLPDYPEAGGAITPRQILGHLSGIRHYQPKDFLDDWDSKHFETVQASLVTFQSDPLLHAPGEKEHYSTYAFTLLAAVLEVAGGASFPDLVEREVAVPLGISTLGTDRRDLVIEGRVAFYDRASGAAATPLNATPIDPSYKWAGGGLIASAEDLVRFGAAHLEPGYLSPATLTGLFTRQRTTAGQELAVGLTWRLGHDADGRSIRHHTGSQEGSRALLLLYPEERLVVAMLSNLGGVPSDILVRAQQMAAPFLPLPPTGATPAETEQ